MGERAIDYVPLTEDLGLVVSLRLLDGTELTHTFVVPAATFAKTLEARTRDGLGIVRIPFSIHNHDERYHTICRRAPDDGVDEVDW